MRRALHPEATRFMKSRKLAVATLALLLACLVLASAPASADTAARPFPFHARLTSGVIKPSNVSQAAMDAKIRSFYGVWKSTYLRRTGGEYWVKYNDTNTTVSEAHGYGMVLAAYMADKAILDSMFRYFRQHPSVNAPHLMAWKQTLRGGRMVNIDGPDSATDGDMDVAYALLLADVQWGSGGAINYKAEALKVLHDILAHEVNAATSTFTPGDWADGADSNHTRPSDFMVGHLIAFAKGDRANAAKWNRIYSSISRIVNFQFTHGSQNTGLMPDFMVKSGAKFVPVPGEYLESPHDGDFSYNACRTPWRLAISHILSGRTDMLAALRKQARWSQTVARGVPTNIRAGYFVRNGVNGRPFVDYDDLPFTAPMAVVAMTGGTASQGWLNSLWRSITAGQDYPVRTSYYGDTLRLQVMLTVAGDWWQP